MTLKNLEDIILDVKLVDFMKELENYNLKIQLVKNDGETTLQSINYIINKLNKPNKTSATSKTKKRNLFDFIK